MIKYTPVNEVTVIIKPEVVTKIVGYNKVPRTETHFHDLSGNRVSKIPRTKRIICLENDCYLGLRGEKWVTVDPKEVEKNVSSKNFVENHSVGTKLKIQSSTPKTEKKVETKKREKIVDKIIKENFIIDFYNNHKRKDCILSIDEMISLNQKWLSNNIFKGDDLGKFIKGENRTDIYGETIFGLTNGTLFNIKKVHDTNPHRHVFIIYFRTHSIKLDQKFIFNYLTPYGSSMKSDFNPTDKIDDIKLKYLKRIGVSFKKNEVHINPKNKPLFNTTITFNNQEMKILNLFVDSFLELVQEIELQKKEKEEEEIKQRKIREKEKIKKDTIIIVNKKTSLIEEFDKNNDGTIDIIEGEEFMNLFRKHQKLIINVDRSYVQKFVKVSSYLNTKKENIQTLFNILKKDTKPDKFDRHIGILKNQIHTYELLLFHSLNMISSLIDDDMITFYEIYESFDKLGIFNSNWENEVSGKLREIDENISKVNEGMVNLMYSINEVGNKISSQISNLTYVTQGSFKSLTETLQTELKSIDSSIKVNNLYSLISTYQLYKINKQTKPLLPDS